jgi:hypothetical protein
MWSSLLLLLEAPLCLLPIFPESRSLSLFLLSQRPLRKARAQPPVLPLRGGPFESSDPHVIWKPQKPGDLELAFSLLGTFPLSRGERLAYFTSETQTVKYLA